MYVMAKKRYFCCADKLRLCAYIIRLDLSKYDTINVGDETHEKVCQDLKLYFRKFNRKMKIHVKHEECTYQLPCYVLKVQK